MASFRETQELLYVMQWALLLMQNYCCSMRKAGQIIWIFLKEYPTFSLRTKMEPSVQAI